MRFRNNNLQKMEFRIAQHMMEGNDFFEGVRSVLVDRDHVPQWQHDSLEAVTNDEVRMLFRESKRRKKKEKRDEKDDRSDPSSKLCLI